MLAKIGRSYPAPGWALKPAAPRPRLRASYEGATTGRRARGWISPTIGPNDSTLSSLRNLRDRSRQAYRNEAYGGGAIDYRVEQLIGTGIEPRSLAEDEAFRDQVQKVWLRWTDESDADGTLDYYGQEAQGTRCWQEAGEVFIRRRRRLASDGLTVPLQLQVLEPEFCPHDHNRPNPLGDRIRAGIEFSPIGRRSAYWFYRARPGDQQDLDTSQLVRIPADDVVHMYLPSRAGQLRGVPMLHRALLTLRELDVGDDATLLRWQLGNLFAGFLERQGPVTDPQVDPITGRPFDKDADGQPMIALEPGSFHELYPGEKVTFNDPPEAGQTYEAFMRHQLRKTAIATRTPYYALTGDMAQVNDRTIRVILQDFRRGLEQLQHQIIVFQLCRRVWAWWFDAAVLSGVLDVPVAYFIDPAPWRAVEWATDRFGYINPVQDIEADRNEIRAGMASRTQKVKARGYDVEDVDRQRAEDNAREDRLGLVSDSDARKTAQTGTAQPVPRDPADPEPEPAPTA